MSNVYPFPQAEYYTEPSNAFGVIREELRFYPDTESMKDSLRGIHAIYKSALFYDCMEYYAYYMQKISVETGRVPYEESKVNDEDFMNGAVMAMHAMLKPLNKEDRQYVLNRNLIDEYFDNFPEDDAGEILENTAVEQLSEFQSGGWHDLLRTQTPRVQRHLLMLADRIYGDTHSSHEAEDSFVAGYLLTAAIVELCLGVGIDYTDSTPTVAASLPSFVSQAEI